MNKFILFFTFSLLFVSPLFAQNNSDYSSGLAVDSLTGQAFIGEGGD